MIECNKELNIETATEFVTQTNLMFIFISPMISMGETLEPNTVYQPKSKPCHAVPSIYFINQIM